MKKILLFFVFIIATIISHAQCSTVGAQIANSDTTSIKLYNAGFFNIPSGFANVCEWEVTTFSGELVHEDVTSGDSSDEQSSTSFDHAIPITDSMKVSIIITNEMEGFICSIADTIFWEETEVLPGSFIGNWSILSSNGGVESAITSIADLALDHQKMEIIPSLVDTHFEIKTEYTDYSFVIFDAVGRIMANYNHPQQHVDIAHFTKGIYFIRFWDENENENGNGIITKKIVKR